MATILQKMFLPKRKLKTLEEAQKIMNLISGAPVYRKVYTQKNGTVVINHLYAVAGVYNVHADYIYDWSRAYDERVSYRLLVSEQKRTHIATNSHVDKLAKRVYINMRQIHDKAKKRVK